MNWFFIRHGQINSNLNKVYSGRSDEPLNAQGLEQACQAAELIKSKAIDRVISSPLTRAGQTANIIASENGLKMTYDPAFNEMKFGAWEGKSESSIQQQYPLEWRLWNTSPHQLKLPGRETLQQMQQRVVERMHNISLEGRDKAGEDQAIKDQTILVVTHVAVIRVALLYAQQRPLSEYKSVSVDNCQLFPISLIDHDLQKARMQCKALREVAQ
jgi:broad specificity phosphatase PhoE